MKTTLLITTHERGHLLKQSLDRLTRLTLPAEVLVVDDGGDDETPSVVQEFAARVPIEVRYLYTHNPGPTLCSHARNVGFRNAAYDWVITSEPELVWKADLVPIFIEQALLHLDTVVSTGRVWFSPQDTIEVETCPIPQGADVAEGWVAPHAAIWKRDWIYAVGGWDESFPGNWGWDDTDLMSRLSKGLHIGQYQAPAAEAVHLHHEKGADILLQNEKHFLAKRLDQPEGKDNMIANKGVEWGSLKVKP